MCTRSVQIQVYLSYEHGKNVKQILWAWIVCAEFLFENILYLAKNLSNEDPTLENGFIAWKGLVHGGVFWSFAVVLGAHEHAGWCHFSSAASGTFLQALTPHDWRLSQKTVYFHLQVSWLMQLGINRDELGYVFEENGSGITHLATILDRMVFSEVAAPPPPNPCRLGRPPPPRSSYMYLYCLQLWLAHYKVTE